MITRPPAPIPDDLVSVHGREITKIEDMPHHAIAVTVETSRGRLAVLLDRAALYTLAQHAARIRREAARNLMPNGGALSEPI